MNSSDVATVLVNGKVVLEERNDTADEGEILQKAEEWGRKIWSASSH
jgi:hypothetical protein